MFGLIVFLVACRDGDGAVQGLRFRDVTKASGVDFEHF
jgi:hypothetical protein